MLNLLMSLKYGGNVLHVVLIKINVCRYIINKKLMIVKLSLFNFYYLSLHEMRHMCSS